MAKRVSLNDYDQVVLLDTDLFLYRNSNQLLIFTKIEVQRLVNYLIDNDFPFDPNEGPVGE